MSEGSQGSERASAGGGERGSEGMRHRRYTPAEDAMMKSEGMDEDWIEKVLKITSALYRLYIGHRRRRACCAGIDVPVLEMTASAAAFQPVHGTCLHMSMRMSTHTR